MTIYQYPDTESLMLSTVFVIVPLLLIGVFLYFIITNGKKKNIAIGRFAFIFPLCSILIMAICMFPLCFKMLRLHALSKQDSSDSLSGSLEILEETEHWYRDDFQGYTLRIKVDGTEISPENTFSKEMLDTLKKQTAVTIYYDESNGELYILKIIADLANP